MSEPLVTKAEHLEGTKTLILAYRWGEALTVKLRALRWREIKELSSRSVAENLDYHELMLEASLLAPNEPGLLDRLDGDSASLLQRTLQALNLGESTLKKTLPEPTPAIPSNIAGPMNANSSPPDGPPTRLENSARPGSLSTLSSLSAPELDTISAPSPSPLPLPAVVTPHGS